MSKNSEVYYKSFRYTHGFDRKICCFQRSGSGAASDKMKIILSLAIKFNANESVTSKSYFLYRYKYNVSAFFEKTSIQCLCRSSQQ